MKILVATELTQGTAPDDYHYCVEGELVWIQEPCARDREDPNGPCGCGRGFAGAASHKATTTALIVDSDMTREEMVLAFETSLVDGGWPGEWAEHCTHENLDIANTGPVGTIVERCLDQFFMRAIVLGG
jgi:hypothetical protein